MTPSTTTTVTEEVGATDDIIYVADASALSTPEFAANIWGVVSINGERIMYRQIDVAANTISSLLRGTAGTAADSHAVGADVYNMGRSNLMPDQFQNYIVANSFLGNGTTSTFTTDIIVNNTEAVEVYLGGTLQTSGYEVTNIASVVVSFDTPPADGTEVSITVRRGVTWYNPGDGTPSNGVPLQETNNPAALFLRGLN
jgi:hypothetical protein